MAKNIPYTRGIAERRAFQASKSRQRELKKQGARHCPICKKLAQLVSDHCHTTGADREYICGSCNKGLGFFRDDPIALRRAADYIERHRGLPAPEPEDCEPL